MSNSSRIPKITEGKCPTPRSIPNNNALPSSSLPRHSSARTQRLSRPVKSDFNSESSIDRHSDELRDNGFIKLNTHDVGLVEEHVPGIEAFAADLQAAVDAAWPTRKRSRYGKAHVLLLSWEDDNLGVNREMHRLEYVFSNLYRFDVQCFKIPRKTAGKATTSRILSFLENDGPETLFILHYAGHARLSHRSSEPPIWSATDTSNSPTLPSGGVQQLFEEAESDVLLLYDTCHSSHPAVNIGGQGVTEVIAACGFETEAPAVGPHSFTNALIRELEEAFNGPPLSVAELHGRIIGSLKNWKPSLLRDENGHVWTDQHGQPRYECHKRRTPVHCFLTNETPYRSIMLAPLPSQLSHSAVARIEHSPSLKLTATNSLDASQSIRNSEHSTAPTSVSDSSKGSRGPQVLLAIRLEDDYLLDDRQSGGGKKLQTWAEWLRSAPNGIRDITIQGIYKSFSTLVLISMPVVVWDILPDNAAYSFVGFVQSGNLAHDILKNGRELDVDVPNDTNINEKHAPHVFEGKAVESTQQRIPSIPNRDSGFSELKDTADELSVTVTNTTGDRHKLPYHMCSSWNVFDHAMKATFPSSDPTGRAVHQSHYQMVDQNHTIILPQMWEKYVRPGASLKIHVWQGPGHFKPLTPPPAPAPGASLSPQPLSCRPLVKESLKRQRTLKRRAGFVLPKPHVFENRPPSPEESSDERFEPKQRDTMGLVESRSSHPPRSGSLSQKLPETPSAQRPRPTSSPPFTTSRISYPTTEKSRDTSRYETWSGFSKTSNQHIAEKTRLKIQIKPTRARSLHEKIERQTPDPFAPRRSLSEASEKVIARAVVHKLRKEKASSMLKSQYSGSTLRTNSIKSQRDSGKFDGSDCDGHISKPQEEVVT
ncbi:uncharacterized protein LY89DRAFT_685147 [Mollisia scopiformis]|uniref:Ubiquitin-like domain-containing protein n=1 Tax=Mollisia scopiformis TaxID=149040 RepID=A0A194XAR7_MOLSC|nr:uncharacterized protein LY89DRAFT_685147 [Mollisia scopiformis]KUJ17234.1 hypothetical protein LY89DRAFT_685147 [Mollisia scopiformis]